MKNRCVFWLLRQLRRRIPALVALVAANVGVALLAVRFALGTKNVINSAVDGSGEAFLRACTVQAGIIACLLVCLFVARWLNARLHDEMDRDWKRNVLHGLLRGDYAGVSAYHSGELINRLTNDVRTVNEGVLNTLPNLASMATRLVAVIAVMTAMAPWFTLALAAFGAIAALTTGVVRKRVRGLHKNVSAANGRVSGFIQEILEKLMLVQALDVAAEVERRSDALLEERWQFQRKKRSFTLTASTCVSLLNYGASFAALAWCGFEVHRGQMSFGELTAVTQLVSLLTAPLVNLTGVIPQWIAMMSSCERLMELEALRRPEDGDGRMDVSGLYGEMEAICAEDMSFSYERELVYDKSAFSLPKGSFAIVTGPSGIGKSTLLKLLLGIFRPEQGRLYVDCGSKRVPLDWSTRRMFAYVPQGNLLFSGTLRDNLTVVKPDATEEELARAVYVSAMDQYLPELPSGLDTVLGESGAGLSEGQAQRLSIARAVLSGAPVLLLDECTSALDEATEQVVLSRLRTLPGRTCIAVTHRPSAVEMYDCRLEVGGGKISCVYER